MAIRRIYVRDKRGRFASTGSSKLGSPIAAQTKLAGKYEQAIKKNDGDWELNKPNLPVRAVMPTANQRRTSGRMSNTYRGDVKGLRQDMRLEYEAAKATSLNKVARAIRAGKVKEDQAGRALQRELRKQMKWGRLV